MTNARSFELPELHSLLVTLLARELRLDPKSVDLNRPFTHYGLDSIAGVTIAGDLEEELAIDLPSTLLWDCPNITALASHLRALLCAQAAETV